jgi:hypothetical protein
MASPSRKHSVYSKISKRARTPGSSEAPDARLARIEAKLDALREESERQ